jgi:hypothetical protein
VRGRLSSTLGAMGLSALLSRPGRAVARAVHGDSRTSEGYLRLGRAYVLPEQETALGLCYLGLPAGPLFLAIVWYVAWTYGERRGMGAQAHFASWSAMPSEVRILTVVAIVSWVIAFASMAQLAFLKQALAEQPLSDLE